MATVKRALDGLTIAMLVVAAVLVVTVVAQRFRPTSGSASRAEADVVRAGSLASVVRQWKRAELESSTFYS